MPSEAPLISANVAAPGFDAVFIDLLLRWFFAWHYLEGRYRPPMRSPDAARRLSDLHPAAELYRQGALAMHRDGGVAQTILQRVDPDLPRRHVNPLELRHQAAHRLTDPAIAH